MSIDTVFDTITSIFFALLVEEVIANLLLVWLNFLELTVYVLESGNDRPGRMVENQTFTIGMYI